MRNDPRSRIRLRSKFPALSLSLLLSLSLIACGGGGGGTSADPASNGGGGNGGSGGGTGGTGGTGNGGSGASGFMEGVLIGSPFKGSTAYDSAELSLASGQLSGLPRSAWSIANRGEPDQWAVSSATGASSDMARQDWVGDVDFFDRKTLARTGGFSLSSLPGTNLPKFYSIVKPSPDGQHVLAYWKADYHDENPVLAVFDRSGNVVQEGISVDYDPSFYWNAFDWLPDGRYIFLAGPTLAIGTVGSNSIATSPVTPPNGVGTGGAELSVSPDGTKLALKLEVDMPDQNGIVEGRGVLFITDTQATTFRQLTTLSARAQASDGEIAHSNPVWSPDGQYLAFSIAYPQSGLAIPIAGCPAELVLPVSSATVAIDGLDDPDSEHFLAANPAGGGTMAVQSCFQQVSWFAGS